jgi:hypothetical protein
VSIKDPWPLPLITEVLAWFSCVCSPHNSQMITLWPITVSHHFVVSMTNDCNVKICLTCQYHKRQTRHPRTYQRSPQGGSWEPKIKLTKQTRTPLSVYEMKLLGIVDSAACFGLVTSSQSSFTPTGIQPMLSTLSWPTASWRKTRRVAAW